MKTMPITEARNKFMKLPEQAAGDQVIAVTGRNREVMAVMSWELYEGLPNTLEVLLDPELMHQLKTGHNDVKAGRTHSLREVCKGWGFEIPKNKSS